MLKKLIFLTGLLIAVLMPARLDAAIGCTLTNPAQDLKFLFPEVTGFKEEVKEFRFYADGPELYEKLKFRLGGDLDPVYESYDTPFTVYHVFNGEKLIGIVHGVNIPGRGGVIQLFIASDPVTGEIRQFFFQRLESQVARFLRGKRFRESFHGLTLADFYMNDYFAVADPDHAGNRVGMIPSPLPQKSDKTDYLAALRGLRKNLILLDFFVYERMNEKFFNRAQELLAQKEKKGEPQ